MRICIANRSRTISPSEFRATVHAVTRQVHEDFAPLWGMDAEVRYAAVSRDDQPNPELNRADAILYVGELEDDRNSVEKAVGYHAQNHSGIPYGFVFADVAAKLGEAWSVTLSHEVLELIADPDVNLLVAAPHPQQPSATVLRAYEVCDPVQGDAYAIDGIAVSNFVMPLYFSALARAVRRAPLSGPSARALRRERRRVLFVLRSGHRELE